MHWEVWDTEINGLVATFDTEDEALQGVADMLAVNAPDLVDELVVVAMYDEGESHDVELPPVLEGEGLKARLAETAPISQARAVHERIRTWVTEEGWGIRDVPIPETSFNVMVTRQNGLTVNIYQRNEHRDRITISDHAILQEPGRSDLAQLPSDVLRATVHDIYRDVLMMGLDLDGLDVPPEEMRFSSFIYFDGLTKNTFMSKIDLILRARALTTRTLRGALEATGKPSSAAVESLRLAS